MKSPAGTSTARRQVWAWLLALMAATVGGTFLYAAGILLLAMGDPALRHGGVPRLARTLHHTLSPRYARWARARLAHAQPQRLSLEDISGTEWPLYGSVFYLRAEEALQAAWEKDHALFAQEPRVYAGEAIEAAARLVADPGHAAWVKIYWKGEYLERENVFYRMLLISALASHRRLTGSEEFVPLLRQQTESLAAELDAAPTGWLDDYPGQCFPTDIMSAWEAIQRADAVLGLANAGRIARARKGFSGARLSRLGLPPYMGVARTGEPIDASRGCSNSNVCMLTPAVWPDLAREFYQRYESAFWQRDWLAAGFREFPRGAGSPQWYFDVDAGPVIRGNGFAACGFGVAAARAQGRFDHAYPLSMEMIALSQPLPGGRLLLPRLVSNSSDAPLLGEAAILFALTQATAAGFAVQQDHAPLPGVVWFSLALNLGAGGLLLWPLWRQIRLRRVTPARPGLRQPSGALAPGTLPPAA